MYPTQTPPAVIEIRHKSSTSILFIVAGSILLAIGLTALLLDALSYWLLLGPLFIAGGIVSRSKPFMVYDIGQGALFVYGPLGNKVRTFGAPKGERIVFDGTQVMRLRADGSQKRVRTGSGNPEDVQRLHQTLWSLQQPPAPQR